MADCRKIGGILLVIIVSYLCFEQITTLFHLLSLAQGNSNILKAYAIRNITIPKYPSTNQSNIIRDYNLSSLLSILNSQPNLFKSWDHSSNDELFSLKYSIFISSLLPWLLGNPPAPLSVPNNPFASKLDCSDPRYALVLSGKRLSKPRVIVDFVPFGYDIDKLEIRLLENFNYVDAFVIYESMMTQTGTKKSLIFQMVKNSARFIPFKSKIIHLYANSFELKERLKEGWQWAPDNWELEEMMRTEMVRRFQEMSPADDQYPLYLRVMSSVLRPLRTVQESLKRRNVSVPVELRWSSADSALQSGALNRVVGSLWSELQTCSFSKAHDFADPLVLAIQNDGDEIPAGSALLHLKHCALRNPIDPTFLPIFSYKNSVELIHLEGEGNVITGERPSGLARFVPLGMAIYVSPLLRFVAHNNTFRTGSTKIHMNVGSGVHLSSVADPVERWFKSISTQHGMQNMEIRSAVPQWFIEAGQDRRVTEAMVRNISAMNEACASRNKNLLPVGNISSSKQRDFLRKSLPWAIRYNPDRYPFLVPPCASIRDGAAV